MSRIALAILLACLAGCHAPASRACKLVPITGNAEALAGARAAPTVEAQYGGVTRDLHAEDRMKRVARRLTGGLPDLRGDCHYRLFDSDRIDAVSLPGGRIYVTRALYARLTDEDLVAAVLAHEMAHLEAKDHFKRRPADPDEALDRELSADTRAVKLLANAGVPVQALVDLIRLIEDAQPARWVEARTRNLIDLSDDPDNLIARAGTP